MGNLVARAGAVWNGLAGPSRRLIIGAGLIFLIGLIVLWKLSGSTAYSTLVSDASPGEASAVAEKLRSLGVAYKLTNEGTAIQVPADKVDQARLDLAQSNLLSGGGSTVGFEIFDKQSLGATDFTQRVNLVRATEGELARTIAQLDPIAAATVKIAMPQEELFSREQEPTTASVLLTLKAGQTLDPGQVRGIANLVAMAVPGLKTSHITITDSQGNILNGNSAEGDVAGANARMALEGSYERDAQSRLDAMLTRILGPNMAVAQVDAVLNLDRVRTESETFDPGKVAPLDQEESTETLRGSGSASGGTAGAGANTPGTTYPATGSSGGNTNYRKNTNRVRNGVDHTRSSTVEAPGTLTSQSISVQVSDKAPPGAVAKIEKAVQAAVGFKQGRDQISVQAVPFATVAADKAAADGTAATSGAKGGMDMMSIAKTGAVVIGVLLLLLMARKSLRRRQSELEKALPELLARGPVPVAELTPGSTPQLEGHTRSGIEQQMEDLAKRRPEDVAQLLRGWLVEGNR